MTKMRFKLSALFIFGLGLTGIQAQTMYVRESNGTQTTYALNEIQKMSFSIGNLTITKTDNSGEVYALDSLRHLNFTDIPTGLEEPLIYHNPILSAYLNPTNDVLNINLKETGKIAGIITIINFEGKTMLSRQVSIAGVYSFDISRLPKGIYFCRYANETETSTVKIIKQ